MDFDNGFFVEAGANDGHTQSNTYYLERRRNWRGILIEPVPDLAETCKQHRPRSLVVNSALVSKDYQGSSIVLQYAGLMSLVVGAQGSRDAEQAHISQGLQQQGIRDSYELTVPARTLEDILEEAGSPTVDLLSLDVEGYELQVLEGLDFETHRPHRIVVEARFEQDIDTFLRARDYELVERLSFHDLLYVDARRSTSP